MLISPGRKIRDRIAKLQERVIANELRAAAALNGWDQTYAPSPLVSPRHGSHQDAHFIGSRDPSPLGTEPSTLFMPPYAVPSTPSWSGDWPVSPYPGVVTGDPTFFMDGAFMGDTLCSAPYVHPVGLQSTMRNGFEGEEMHDSFGGGGCLSSNLPPKSTNQPSYYVATGKIFYLHIRYSQKFTCLTTGYGLQKQLYRKSFKPSTPSHHNQRSSSSFPTQCQQKPAKSLHMGGQGAIPLTQSHQHRQISQMQPVNVKHRTDTQSHLPR